MSEWRSYVQPPRQGTAHINRQIPCQDAAVLRSNDCRTVLVLSDGLGELEKSELASKAVTESVADYLMQYTFHSHDVEELKLQVLQIAQDALTRQAEAAEIEISEIDCTLLFFMNMYREGVVYTGQIGDGAICLVAQTGAYLVPVLNGPKVSSNMTKTLMSSDAFDYFCLKKYKIGNFKGVVLCSDGLENEIYSTAGGWKKMIEWYANLISSNDDETCRTEIESRWNQLTSDENYGFTDDMSLAAAFEKNMHFTFPDEVNWLCACGHRNRLESTRCEQCGSDILDVYHGISFKKTKAGNKKNYFKYLNMDPETELKVLSRYSRVPISKELNVAFAQTQSNALMPAEADAEQKSLTGETAVKRAGNDNLHIMNMGAPVQNENKSSEPESSSPAIVQTEYKEAEPERSASQKVKEKVNPFNDRLRNLKSVIMVLVVAVTYTLGILTAHTLNQKTQSTMAQETEKLQSEINVLQEENEKLIKMNQENTDRISVQEEELKVIHSLPGNYEASVFERNVYIGETDGKVPCGIGTVFTDDSIVTGQYEDGKKNGVFIEQFRDGTVNEYIYVNDELVEHSENHN